MKITHLTEKIRLLPDLVIQKSTNKKQTVESYKLLYGRDTVCSFDFANYQANGRYYSHAEIENFKISKCFQRKLIGAKALLQVKEIISRNAKDKRLNFVMFKINKSVKGNLSKLLGHLGALEYYIEDLSAQHFLYLTNPGFYKNVKRRLIQSPRIKPLKLSNLKNIFSSIK